MWLRIAWFHMWENAGLREQQGTAARVLRETHWFLPLVYVSIILRLGVLGFLQRLVWHSAIWRKRKEHLWEHWGCYGIITLSLHLLYTRGAGQITPSFSSCPIQTEHLADVRRKGTLLWLCSSAYFGWQGRLCECSPTCSTLWFHLRAPMGPLLITESSLRHKNIFVSPWEFHCFAMWFGESLSGKSELSTVTLVWRQRTWVNNAYGMNREWDGTVAVGICWHNIRAEVK